MWLIQVLDMAQVLLWMWLGTKKTILNIKGAEYLNRIFQMQNHTQWLCFSPEGKIHFFSVFLLFSFFLCCLSFFQSKPIVSGVRSALAFICSWDVLLCCQLMSNSVLFYTSGSLLHWHIPFPYLWFFPLFHVHPSLCFSSSRSISFTRLLPSLLKAIWASHLSSPPSPSLSLQSWLPYSTYLFFTFTRCQHFLLLPLLLLHLSPSSPSFKLSASPRLACELSHSLCSHQKCLALSWSFVMGG